MLSVLTYSIIAFVLIFIAYRSNILVKKKENPFAVYFFWGFGTAGMGQILSLALMVAAYFLKQDSFLYWADVVGRIFLYISAAFFVQIPLYLYFPTSKKRFIVSYIVAGIGIGLLLYSLTLSYLPFFDTVGLIHWETPEPFGFLFGPPLLIIWAAASIVFLFDYIKNRTLKSLVLSIGFVLVTIGAILQDFGKTAVQFMLINLTMIFGFIAVFLSSVLDKRNK